MRSTVDWRIERKREKGDQIPPLDARTLFLLPLPSGTVEPDLQFEQLVQRTQKERRLCLFSSTVEEGCVERKVKFMQGKHLGRMVFGWYG